ncbi:hypothetical protein M422DRAFT_246948 [Sphaerobolus stellatus SS14]|nr:hypothetical protein M422DRAFT_246948 [Sphaerobolus stellatus SS14]
MIFDFIVYFLTSGKRAKGTPCGTLITVLVQGTNVYFLALFLVNVANVALIVFIIYTNENAWNANDLNWQGTVLRKFGWVGVSNIPQYSVQCRIAIINVLIQLYAGIFNVQLAARLFLDLREAAYQQRAYESPSEVTKPAGQSYHFDRSDSAPPSEEFFQDRVQSDEIATKNLQFINRRTLWDLIRYEDFALELRNLDDKSQVDGLKLVDEKDIGDV